MPLAEQGRTLLAMSFSGVPRLQGVSVQDSSISPSISPSKLTRLFANRLGRCGRQACSGDAEHKFFLACSSNSGALTTPGTAHGFSKKCLCEFPIACFSFSGYAVNGRRTSSGGSCPSPPLERSSYKAVPAAPIPGPMREQP